jgi:hypothetical protein
MRIVFKCFSGWGKWYWIQIRLTGSCGIGKFWYDVNRVSSYLYEVTPDGKNGFRTLAEAEKVMEKIKAIRGRVQ